MNGIFSCFAPFRAAPRGASGTEFEAREPAPGKDSSLPGKPRNPGESLHAHDIHLAYGPIVYSRRNFAGKSGPVSEHRESDDHQAKDAHRDDRFRCPIHRCLQQATIRRDASLALTRGSHSGRFSILGRRASRQLPEIPPVPVPTAGRVLRQSAGCHFSLYQCPRAACRRGFEARRPPASAAGVAAHVEKIP